MLRALAPLGQDERHLLDVRLCLPMRREAGHASFIGSWPLALHPVRKCRVRGDSTSPHPKLQAPACSHGRAPGRAGGHFQHVRPAQMTTGSPSARFLGKYAIDAHFHPPSEYPQEAGNSPSDGSISMASSSLLA